MIGARVWRLLDRKRADAPAPLAPVRDEEAAGTVYFLRPSSSESQSIIKIGYTGHPLRLRAAQIARGEYLWPVGHRPGAVTLLLLLHGCGRLRERELHEQFAHLRIEREWFRAEPELLEFIDARGGLT